MKEFPAPATITFFDEHRNILRKCENVAAVETVNNNFMLLQTDGTQHHVNLDKVFSSMCTYEGMEENLPKKVRQLYKCADCGCERRMPENGPLSDIGCPECDGKLTYRYLETKVWPYE